MKSIFLALLGFFLLSNTLMAHPHSGIKGLFASLQGEWAQVCKVVEAEAGEKVFSYQIRRTFIEDQMFLTWSLYAGHNCQEKVADFWSSQWTVTVEKMFSTVGPPGVFDVSIKLVDGDQMHCPVWKQSIYQSYVNSSLHFGEAIAEQTRKDCLEPPRKLMGHQSAFFWTQPISKTVEEYLEQISDYHRQPTFFPGRNPQEIAQKFYQK